MPADVMSPAGVGVRAVARNSMDTHQQLESLARVIQIAIAPVFLLSGIGALLAVMTNRLARVIDRARTLDLRRSGADEATLTTLNPELQSLADRSRLIS